MHESEKENVKEKYMNLNFQNFKDYSDFFSIYVIIRVSEIINSWRDILCSCKEFIKSKKWIHIYTYAKKIGRLDDIICVTFISSKSKRGRQKNIPKNASRSKN